MKIAYRLSASVLRISPVNPKNRTDILLLLKSLNVPKVIGTKYISVNIRYKPLIHLYNDDMSVQHLRNAFKH